MLDIFIDQNRDATGTRSQPQVAARCTPKPNDCELANGIPVFLDPLAAALRIAESSDVIDHEAIRRTAGAHGASLLRLGLTVGQVVHDYGDVCQTITEMAVEQHAELPSS